MSSSELPDVVGENACVSVVESEAVLVEPGAERAEVDSIGPSRRLREATVLEEALDCLVGVHTHMYSRSCPSRLR